MTDDPARAVTRPPDRYGDDRQSVGRRRVVRIVVGVLAVAAVTWWVVVALARSTPDVTYDLLGFDHVTDTSLDVRFRIERQRDLPVVCVLRARDRSGAEVGVASVTIPASDGDRVELVSTVRTTRRPVSAEIGSCTSAPARGLDNGASTQPPES
jgi:hypothetical protein